MFLLVIPVLVTGGSWKGTFVQDDDFVRMYYNEFNPKLNKVHGSARLYEFTISSSEVIIKVLDTFGLTITQKGTLLYSSKEMKTIIVIDSIFQSAHLYNLYLTQGLCIMFWSRSTTMDEKGTATAEIHPMKFLTAEETK